MNIYSNIMIIVKITLNIFLMKRYLPSSFRFLFESLLSRQKHQERRKKECPRHNKQYFFLYSSLLLCDENKQKLWHEYDDDVRSVITVCVSLLIFTCVNKNKSDSESEIESKNLCSTE